MSWIQTYTGRKFHPLTPRASEVDLRDIAHALSLKCRFGGHCRTFYSVAEHSVRVARLLEPKGRDLAIWGLMHDAGEAYLADVGRPIKPFLQLRAEDGGEGVKTFDAIEDEVLAAVAEALGFPRIDYEAVREADNVLLATEARDLMSKPPEAWNLGVEPLALKIVPWKARDAEKMFLGTWNQLKG